jgi:hypothetical protein
MIDCVVVVQLGEAGDVSGIEAIDPKLHYLPRRHDVPLAIIR